MISQIKPSYVEKELKNTVSCNNQIYMFFKDRFLGKNSLEGWMEKDAGRAPGAYPSLTPKFDGYFPHTFCAILPSEAGDEEITETVKNLYEKTLDKQYGPFGNAVIAQEIRTDGATVVTGTVVRKAFHLPALTTDVPIFLQCRGKISLVLGKRKAEPGKNKGATFGGFNNVEKNPDTGVFDLHTSLHTAQLESAEEAGVKIDLDRKDLVNDPNWSDHEITATLSLGKGDHVITTAARIQKSGYVHTSDAWMREGGERIEGTEEKRVYLSEVVTITGEVDCSPEELAGSFEAGDDITATCCIDVTEAVENSISETAAKQYADRVFTNEGMGILHHAEVIKRGLLSAHSVFFPKSRLDS